MFLSGSATRLLVGTKEKEEVTASKFYSASDAINDPSATVLDEGARDLKGRPYALRLLNIKTVILPRTIKGH